MLKEWKNRTRFPLRVRLACDVMWLPWLLCVIMVYAWGGDGDLKFLSCIVNSQTNRQSAGFTQAY